MTERLKELVDGFKLSQAIYAATALRVPDLLPRSSDELAAETETDPETLYRLLRALAAGGVLHEREGRVFDLAPAADGLRTDAEPSLRDWVLNTMRPVQWSSWSGLLESVRDGSFKKPRKGRKRAAPGPDGIRAALEEARRRFVDNL